MHFRAELQRLVEQVGVVAGNLKRKELVACPGKKS